LYTGQNVSTGADHGAAADEKHVPTALATEFNESTGISPDMHWIAYTSDESGSNEIYVRRFSQVPEGVLSAEEGKWMVSKGGGTGPRWRGDGKELYYRSLDGTVVAAEVSAGKTFRIGTLRPLFRPAVVSPKVFGSYVYYY
jgi:hypothetical protein